MHAIALSIVCEVIGIAILLKYLVKLSSGRMNDAWELFGEQMIISIFAPTIIGTIIEHISMDDFWSSNFRYWTNFQCINSLIEAGNFD